MVDAENIIDDNNSTDEEDEEIDLPLEIAKKPVTRKRTLITEASSSGNTEDSYEPKSKRQMNKSNQQALSSNDLANQQSSYFRLPSEPVNKFIYGPKWCEFKKAATISIKKNAHELETKGPLYQKANKENKTGKGFLFYLGTHSFSLNYADLSSTFSSSELQLISKDLYIYEISVNFVREYTGMKTLKYLKISSFKQIPPGFDETLSYAKRVWNKYFIMFIEDSSAKNEATAANIEAKTYLLELKDLNDFDELILSKTLSKHLHLVYKTLSVVPVEKKCR
jgi:hypothetical protein